ALNQRQGPQRREGSKSKEASPRLSCRTAPPAAQGGRGHRASLMIKDVCIPPGPRSGLLPARRVPFFQRSALGAPAQRTLRTPPGYLMGAWPKRMFPTFHTSDTRPDKCKKIRETSRQDAKTAKGWRNRAPFPKEWVTEDGPPATVPDCPGG